MNKMSAAISIAALVVSASCSKADTNSTQATMDVKEAKSAAKEVPYKSEIERGFTKQFNCVEIPHGEIKIEPSDPGGSPYLNQAQIHYNDKLLTSFTEQTVQIVNILFDEQKLGLVTIHDSHGAPTTTSVYTNKNGELQIEKAYTLEWTPKAIQLRDKTFSDADWIGIPLGKCKVETIVKDIEYHNPLLPQSDDYRLVLGTYEFTPNDFGKSQGNTVGVFKFRALIKLNPFNQTYSFVDGDWGKVDADDWQTKNIPQ
jgi:hypothetical protein